MYVIASSKLNAYGRSRRRRTERLPGVLGCRHVQDRQHPAPRAVRPTYDDPLRGHRESRRMRNTSNGEMQRLHISLLGGAPDVESIGV
jgi:hypothetical protein